MKTFSNHTTFVFAMSTLIALLHAAPAGAMGRSGTATPAAKSGTQAIEHPSQVGTEMQVQIETLRKEVAELKAQMAMAKSESPMK